MHSSWSNLKFATVSINPIVTDIVLLLLDGIPLEQKGLKESQQITSGVLMVSEIIYMLWF